MIKFFVGDRGSGKTLQMVKDSQWFFEKGYSVFSNFPVWGYSPVASPLLNKKKIIRKDATMCNFMYFEDLEQKILGSLENETPTLFLLDEAPVLFHSREWQKFNLDLIYAINQSRKCNIHIFMSAQNYFAVDKQLRNTADYVYMCDKIRILNLYRVSILKPDYFKDEEKSEFMKKFIVKTKLYFTFQIKKYFKYYYTGQVILHKRFFDKYPKLFPDPKSITIKDVLNSSLRHKDIPIPL